MPAVICLGILVVDVIGRPIEHIPPRGTLQLVESISPHIGGCAANTGIGLQKLGVSTAVVGAVGRDGFGQFLCQSLESFGVSANGIKAIAHVPTSATMVLVEPDGERAFLHCVGANASLSDLDFDFDCFEGTPLLHIAGHGLLPCFEGAPCARVLRRAREKGWKTSLDTAGALDARWRENLRLVLPFLDYFVPSLHEVRELFPDADTPESIAARLIECGVGTVALKMGEAGSYAQNACGQQARAPAYEVKAIDATGAGDAFAAGFLAASLRDLPLETCLQMGNATGALCVQQVGTVAGLQDWDTTRALASTGAPRAQTL